MINQPTSQVGRMKPFLTSTGRKRPPNWRTVHMHSLFTQARKAIQASTGGSQLALRKIYVEFYPIHLWVFGKYHGITGHTRFPSI